jgi:5-methylthioadenosine/S-adenosylhomocysteine deaminase
MYDISSVRRGTMIESDGPADVDVLIVGGWVITMNPRREIFREGAVAVRGSRIVAVGHRRDVAGAFRSDYVVDASNMVVTPGLVNGHRHLLCCPKGAMPEGRDTLGVLRGFTYPCFAALSEEHMHLYAIHAAAEMIRFGTTTFEEPGCNHLEAVLDALVASGIRCRVGPWTWDQRGSLGREGLPEWLVFEVDEALNRFQWAIETVRALGDPKIRHAVTLEGVGTCSDALTREAANLAVDAESLAVLHKASSEREVAVELKRFGERPVAHLASIGALNPRVLLNHMTSISDAEVDAVADSGAAVCQNPSTALKLAKGTTQTGKWAELLAAGVPIALGTDAENASNHQDLCRSMHLAALLPRDARRDPGAVSAEQALEMATIGGATALRMDDAIGSLEVGKEADITCFDTSDFDWRPLHNPVANLVYGSTGYAAHTVLIGGEVVLDAKRLVRFDEETLRERVQRQDEEVLSQIGVAPLPRWPVL